jgi:hypothetical protein
LNNSGYQWPEYNLIKKGKVVYIIARDKLKENQR